MSTTQFAVGPTHAAFPMDDASRVGTARRHAAVLASQRGLDDTAAGRLAIVVTELGGNLVRHARGGQLLLADTGTCIEVIAMDRGPGMVDARRSMGDGYSTGSTPGTGLGAVRRLSQDFHLHSVLGEGTVIVARVAGEPAAAVDANALRVGGVAVCAPGEVQCGDGWAVALGPAGGTLLLADGLGHGSAAHQASRAAIEVFRDDPTATPTALLQSVHAGLRTTRGAAVAVLQVDAAAERIEFCGAGNVMGRMISGVSDRSLLMQHGTAGVQLRRTEATSYEWSPHAALVLHSDGIESRWPPTRLLPLLGRDPVLAAAVLIRDHLRGRDDATVVVMTRGRAP